MSAVYGTRAGRRFVLLRKGREGHNEMMWIDELDFWLAVDPLGRKNGPRMDKSWKAI